MESCDKTQPAQNKKDRKRKFKKIYLLLVDLLIVIVIFALLLYKPGRYNPTEVVYNGKVSSYFTHELLPAIYNGAQQQEPFDVIVTEEGINDIVTHFEWPKESEGTVFSAPNVLFVPDRIILMGTAIIYGVELVVTIVGEPNLDQNGLLNLRVVKVKVGAMNVTPLAEMLAKRMYRKRLEEGGVDTEDIRVKILASLLNDEAFEPIFSVDDEKVRIVKLNLEREKLTLGLIPILD